MTTGEGKSPGRSVLSDMPLPTEIDPSVALDGPPVSPAGRIRLYSPDEWEEFIREWATGLPQTYAQIKRLGGAGDKGADIAAFKTDRQFEGPWDCFQAKHYKDPLSFGVAAAEVLKVFVWVVEKVYCLPDSYLFLAPKGLSTQFNMMVSKPTAFRDSFLGRLDKGEALVKDLDAPKVQAVRTLASQTDFGMFKSVELQDALETHSRTRWHAARFATALPVRAASEAPPAEYATDEARYLQQLLAVYAERYPDKITDLASVADVPRVSRHLQRQRVCFFRAESLKGYAREAVPPGTFEKLQGDIYSGVVDVVERDHPNGYTRLAEVLAQVGNLDLNRHKLIAVTEIDDRKGVCHQLANDDRLTWMDEE